LPPFKHGSLLRAIGHNRAQTMILSVDQLTTGLFRACTELVARQFDGTDDLVPLRDRIFAESAYS